jgi:hypothetical protein
VLGVFLVSGWNSKLTGNTDLAEPAAVPIKPVCFLDIFLAFEQMLPALFLVMPGFADGPGRAAVYALAA